MGYADLHIHTTYSWDATSSVAAVIKHAAYYTRLNVIAITDHDRIEGALEALDLAPVYNLEVIPGIEVSTREGHLLSLFITKPILPGRSLEETVLCTLDQGGLCVVPHPMMNGRSGINPYAVQKALLNPQVRAGLVGIELFNAGMSGAQRDPIAISKANWLPLAKVGCSDAHYNRMIGKGMTQFPGQSAEELLFALKNRQTEAVGMSQMHWLDFTVRYVPRLILRYTNSTTWNAILSKPPQHTA
jgi:predicted metal-dependent phosphoesterase TrpH